MDWSSCSVQGAATLSCIPPLIANVVQWLLIFAGTVCLFVIILSGMRMIVSSGDAKKLDNVRRTLAFAVVGLTLVFLSFFIVHLIAQLTGVACFDPTKSFSFTSCQTP